MADAKVKVPLGELGVPGVDEWNGAIVSSWITELRTSDRKVKTYDEMSQVDPTGSAMLQTTSLFMQNVEVTVRPAGKEPVDVEKAAFLEQNLHGMSKSFTDIMSDIILMLAYGWMDLEIVYEKKEDGRVHWKKLPPRHPVTLDHWEWDDNYGLKGMWQNFDSKQVFIPIEKLLHFSTTGMGKNNVEGISIFMGAYKSWFYANNLEILEAIICERMSGTPVVTLPENMDTTEDSEALTQAKLIVRNIKVGDDMGITLPFGWDFKYAMPSEGPALDISAVITRHRVDMARNLLMDFIMISEGGSLAMIRDKSAMYLIALNTYMKRIGEIFNRHAIPRLFDLNSFQEGSGYPQLLFSKISKIDVGDFAELVSNLLNAGGLTYSLGLENQVRQIVGLQQAKESGMLLKPNLPAQNLGTPEGEEGLTMPAGQQITAASEYADAQTAQAADEFADQAGLRLIRVYDRELKELPASLYAADEDDYADIVDMFMSRLSRALKSQLSDDVFAAWLKHTGDKPDIESLKVISDMLLEHAGYIDNSLLPSVREAALAAAREAHDSTLSDKLFALAVFGAVGALRFRTAGYTNMIYKLFANHGTAVRAKRMIDSLYPKNVLSVDYAQGMLSGEDLLVRNVSARDDRVCPTCEALTGLGWTESRNMIPIGERDCKHNDRCYYQYKYRGRVF